MLFKESAVGRAAILQAVTRVKPEQAPDGKTTMTFHDEVAARLVLGRAPDDADDSWENWALSFPSGSFSSWAGIGVRRDPYEGSGSRSRGPETLRSSMDTTD